MPVPFPSASSTSPASPPPLSKLHDSLPPKRPPPSPHPSSPLPPMLLSLPPTLHKPLLSLSLALRRRDPNLLSSHRLALATARMLKAIVSQSEWKEEMGGMERLEEWVAGAGVWLEGEGGAGGMGGRETIITNITRRVLKYLHEEYTTALNAHLESYSNPQAHSPHHRTDGGGTGTNSRSDSDVESDASDSTTTTTTTTTSTSRVNHRHTSPSLPRPPPTGNANRQSSAWSDPSEGHGSHPPDLLFSVMENAGDEDSGGDERARYNEGEEEEEPPLMSMFDLLGHKNPFPGSLPKGGGAGKNQTSSSFEPEPNTTAALGLPQPPSQPQQPPTNPLLRNRASSFFPPPMSNSPSFASLRSVAQQQHAGGAGVANGSPQSTSPTRSPTKAAQVQSAFRTLSLSSSNGQNGLSRSQTASVTQSLAQQPLPRSFSTSLSVSQPQYLSGTRTPLPPTAAATTAMLTEEFNKKSLKLKKVFVGALEELIEELEGVHSQIGDLALDFIHSGETIMTLGKSRTIETFLKKAARKRKISVIVVECDPTDSGLQLARALSTSSSAQVTPIPTTLIPYSTMSALIPKCSKILLPAHSVSADGSSLSFAGSLGMAEMAREWRVPVLVVGGSWKFGPGYGLGSGGGGGGGGGGGAGSGGNATASGGGGRARDLKGPGEMIASLDGKWGTLKSVEDEGRDAEIEMLSPFYDRVPGELIELFITNLGSHPRSLIYRLLTDLYGV